MRLKQCIVGAYCVGRVHNMLLASIIVVGAYCIGRVHNMLPASVINRNGIYV